MMWTTETPGDRRTTMQMAMAEARSRRYEASVLSLKPIFAAFSEMARTVGAALRLIGRAFEKFGEKIVELFHPTPTGRSALPPAVSSEMSGPGFTARARGFSPLPPRWC